MHFTKSSMRRAVATTAAAVLVSGALEAVTAGTASARPRGPNSCAVYNNAINESQISTLLALGRSIAGRGTAAACNE